MFDPQGLSDMDRLDLEQAVAMLKELGAAGIYLFGSMARGEIDEDSDWDFAVQGLSGEKLLRGHGLLLSRLRRESDLVSLEESSPLIEHIRKKREFVRVA